MEAWGERLTDAVWQGGPAEVEPAEVEPAEVEPAEVEPAEVEPAEVKPAEVEPVEVRPADVGPVDVGPIDLGPAKVRLAGRVSLRVGSGAAAGGRHPPKSRSRFGGLGRVPWRNPGRMHGAPADAGRQKGFSALELMVTLGLAAVLAGLAVPGFAAFQRSAGVSSAANELVWALHMARSSAVTRGFPVTVCLSRDDTTCLQTSDAAAGGWLVFQAAGQAVAAPVVPAGPVLHRFRLPEAVEVQGTRPAVTFWPVSRAGSTSTFEICDSARRAPGRSIVVSQTGRPRVATEASSCAG